MAVIRDSGYKTYTGVQQTGNVAVDFVWGNVPPQTNDDRSGTASAAVTAASSNGTVITYTATNSFTAGQKVTVSGLSTVTFNLVDAVIASASGSQFTVASTVVGTAVTNSTTGLASGFTYNLSGGTTGSAYGDAETATVTAASNSSGTITYTAANSFLTGQTVTTTGLGATATPTITAASASGSGSSTTVTFSTANTTGIVVGSVVTIAGITGVTTGTLNGVWYVSAVVANTSFTAAVASPASITVGSPSFGSATASVSSGYNLTGTVASSSTTQFTVTPVVTASQTLPSAALTTQTGTATVNEYTLPGIGADYGWSKTTDFASIPLTETQLTRNVGPVGPITVPSGNVENFLNNYDAFPLNNQTSYKPTSTQGNFNQGSYLVAKITGVTYTSAAGGTLVFTANNNFSTGQTVSITGLYNYVSAGSTQPIGTQYYAPTFTNPSYFNAPLKTYYPVTDAAGNSTTGFGQYNASYVITAATSTTFTITGTASSITITADPTLTTLTGVNGTATVTIAASASTATVPTITGLTVKEADRQLGVVGFNTGTITYRTTGATANNAGTVYSQAVTGSQTLGTLVSIVVYKQTTGENAGTQDGTFNVFS